MKYNVDDLLKLANSDVLTPTKIDSSYDVQKFINTLDIKAGKHRVKNAAIYDAYKNWSGRPLSRHAFFKIFSRFFDAAITNGFRYYNLNYRPIELVNEVDNLKIKI